MPHLRETPMHDRMCTWFAEADFEIGFSLVDMAEAETIFGNHARADRILVDADNVLLDIQHILCRLETRDRSPFVPLVAELRRAIDLARLHRTSPG